ncbi:hypothetical protein F53441_14383 [Fusarium austroafricanum]|uniref:Rhodopsin domain-containing protein n=1 Tax=Fusarium austroafricanum TaxID=2364996 RepID=A0A8H4JE62_9HYPO|nr:hypothetical protein F53441_14383 [Fusarium austroafricanum]
MAADDLSGALFASSFSVIALTTVFIGTQLWVRSSLKTIGKDDCLIAASWGFLQGLCICTIFAAKSGFGKHIDEVSNENLKKFFRYITACSATFSVGTALAKSSFAVLYLRINTQPVLRVLNKCLIIFLAMQAIEEACVVIFQCRPIHATWTVPRPTNAKCLDLRVLWWCTFAFNMCSDLFLFIQPIPAIVWNLHLPMAKRLGLIAMLSLDQLVKPMVWSQVELASLIVCSTIPCLRQVAQKVPWLNHALGLTSDRRSSKTYYERTGSNKTVGSIPLKRYSQSHRESFFQSKSTSRNGYGLTSQAFGGHTKNDSTEEIFPHKTDGSGAIFVTHEVTRVESQPHSAAPSIRHPDDCVIRNSRGT